ncbi:hypothetical protein M3Y99_00697400 [Aphelenchoides fujianensis]|nr:hypothetical protein M3Y99_00697400 [Aphelenchoides fujianensis]
MDDSSCRHDDEGNSCGRLQLPSQLDIDDESRQYALNWKRADGIFFRMFFHARSTDGAGLAELGVVISDFSVFKYADCRLRCRVYGKKKEVVVEKERDHCRFARGEQQQWTFRVSRRRLKEARAKFGPLYAEFKLVLLTNDRLRYSLSPVRSGKPDDARSTIALIDLTSPERARRRPPIPHPHTDDEWTAFYMKVEDVLEKAEDRDTQNFGRIGFLLRYFPPDGRCRTSNFEFVLTHFHNRQRVRLGLQWAVENRKKQVSFQKQEAINFSQCRCSNKGHCQHKRVNKALYRVDSKELCEFAGDRSVCLVLKLRMEEAETRAVSPLRRREAHELPVQHQGFTNPLAVHRQLTADPHEQSALPKELEAARAFVERSAAEVPASREVPRLLAPTPPPPSPLFARMEAAGSHSERPGVSTSISPPAIVAPQPSSASTPELPAIRSTPLGAGTKATAEMFAAGFFLSPFEHVQKTTAVEPIDTFEDKQEGGEVESVASTPPVVALDGAQTPSGIKQEAPAHEPTIEHELQPTEEQPTEEPANEAAVKVEPGGEERAEVAEQPASRKRRPDLPAAIQDEPPQEKRQRKSDANVENGAKRPEASDPPLQGRQLTIAIERDLVIDESAFFAKKLAKQEDPNEGLPAEISSETMAAVVEWIRTKKVDQLDAKAREMYVAAKLLGMPDLQARTTGSTKLLIKTCVEAIKRNSKLPNENHAGALIFAAEHADAELLKTMDFVWERPKLFRKVMKSEEFRRVYRERPGLMEKIVDAM